MHSDSVSKSLRQKIDVVFLSFLARILMYISTGNFIKTIVHAFICAVSSYGALVNSPGHKCQLMAEPTIFVADERCLGKRPPSLPYWKDHGNEVGTRRRIVRSDSFPVASETDLTRFDSIWLERITSRRVSNYTITWFLPSLHHPWEKKVGFGNESVLRCIPISPFCGVLTNPRAFLIKCQESQNPWVLKRQIIKNVQFYLSI